MKWRFWRTAHPPTPDKCNHVGKKARMLNSLDHVPLRSGHHTSFMVLKCLGCGEMFGFPDANLEIALTEGTPEVKDQLRVLAERVASLPALT